MSEYRKLWSVSHRFPSHCGTPSYVDECFYVVETIQDLLRSRAEKYSHGEVVSLKYMGSVSIRVPNA